LPGTICLFTRRCSHGQFFLRPSKATTQLLGYLLAVAAERYRIDIHAFCAMSNHIHIVLTDRDARVPGFSRFFDSLVGRAMNFRLRRSEHFWAPHSFSAVALTQPADVVSKIIYTLANPVSAGLVCRGDLWPGLWSAPRDLGGAPLEFKRPDDFFRKSGATSLPARASLRLTAPAGFDPAWLRKELSTGLEAREQTAALELAACGRGFMGVRRVLAQSPHASPNQGKPRAGFNPRVACKDKWRRIQALGQLVTFLRDYRRALEAWRSGAARVLFPAGTYLMRVLHNAPCEAPG
jgi:REP element-mobilizing transposase RayT